MRDGYGLLVANALVAVQQLHDDVSRLLQDCDGVIGKGKASRFANAVTQDLSALLRADYWMAEAVFCYYYEADGADGVVDAVTACFFDAENRIPEPFLLVGQVKYRVEANAQIPAKCQGWDLRHGYFGWWPNRTPGMAHAGRRDDDRVEWFKVVGVPLFSVRSVAHVGELLAEVQRVALSAS